MLGFFLNAISIVSFLSVKEMRTPSNFLVFGLAVADISLNVNGLTAAYASYLRYPANVPVFPPRPKAKSSPAGFKSVSYEPMRNRLNRPLSLVIHLIQFGRFMCSWQT